MLPYGLVPRAATWGAAGLWLCFVGALVVEASDGPGRLIGSLPAGIATYGLTLLVMLAMPRRPLADLSVLSAVLTIGPELVAAAVRHDVDVTRIVCEMFAISAAMVPVKIERLRHGHVPSPEGAWLGSMVASSMRPRAWPFDLRRHATVDKGMAITSATPRAIVHRMPERLPETKGD